MPPGSFTPLSVCMVDSTLWKELSVFGLTGWAYSIVRYDDYAPGDYDQVIFMPSNFIRFLLRSFDVSFVCIKPYNWHSNVDR